MEPPLPPDAPQSRLWTHPEPAFDFVVVAASFGGVEALRTLVSALPLDFPVPIALVLHMGARPSVLVNILKWRTQLAVRWAEQDQRPRPRTVYVAPPDHHLEVSERRTFHLSDGPKWHATRPAADPLFQSAARVYGRRCLGLVMTGMGSDGLLGARAIRQAGGTVLAQDRATSLAFGMPGAVIDGGQADFVLPLATLAPALVSLVMVPGGADLFGVPRHVA
jgi:two-component system chemotaxis response regulator CheB